MDFLSGGFFCIVLLVALMGVGLQIGLAFLLSGFVTSVLLIGMSGTLSLLGQSSYFSVASPTWACIPLFILMGAFAAAGGYAERAYRGVYALSRRVHGSLAVATCFGCALFGAISGSSIATTAIFGKMALPEMRRLGYDKTLASACIASAGTFASMIPPSMMMIIYALFTQQSVGKLFAAGIIPGIITAVVYSVSIIYRVKNNPKLAPPPPASEQVPGSRKKWLEAWQAWPVVVIALIVLGGIYSGVFTPTEAAAAGALVTLVFGWQQGSLRKISVISDAMKESASTTAMLFLINIGALFYSRVLAVTRMPTEITQFLIDADISRFSILLGIILIMFILGMIMVPVGIYALTLPIVFPMLVKLGYDPIWFGVIALKMTEIGAVTPPVGLNVFAMKGVIPKEYNVTLEDIYRGVWPFVICDLVVLVMLIVFPQIATWLPDLLLGK
jgi:tripartite ATP-independent transporter DctM subunit